MRCLSHALPVGWRTVLTHVSIKLWCIHFMFSHWESVKVWILHMDITAERLTIHKLKSLLFTSCFLKQSDFSFVVSSSTDFFFSFYQNLHGLKASRYVWCDRRICLCFWHRSFQIVMFWLSTLKSNKLQHFTVIRAYEFSSEI